MGFSFKPGTRPVHSPAVLSLSRLTFLGQASILTIEKFGGKPGVHHTGRSGPASGSHRASPIFTRDPAGTVPPLAFPPVSRAGASLNSPPALTWNTTLSPACPRGLLVRGDRRLAALAAPPAHADSALTNALIWFDYLRRQTPIHGLALFLPTQPGNQYDPSPPTPQHPGAAFPLRRYWLRTPHRSSKTTGISISHLRPLAHCSPPVAAIPRRELGPPTEFAAWR